MSKGATRGRENPGRGQAGVGGRGRGSQGRGVRAQAELTILHQHRHRHGGLLKLHLALAAVHQAGANVLHSCTGNKHGQGEGRDGAPRQSSLNLLPPPPPQTADPPRSLDSPIPVIHSRTYICEGQGRIGEGYGSPGGGVGCCLKLACAPVAGPVGGSRAAVQPAQPPFYLQHSHCSSVRLTLSSYTRARRAPKKSMLWPVKVSTSISTSPRLTLSCCMFEANSQHSVGFEYSNLACWAACHASPVDQGRHPQAPRTHEWRHQLRLALGPPAPPPTWKMPMHTPMRSSRVGFLRAGSKCSMVSAGKPCQCISAQWTSTHALPTKPKAKPTKPNQKLPA